MRPQPIGKPPENQACRKALEIARNNPSLVQYIKTKVEKIAIDFDYEEEMQAVLSAVNDTLSMAEYVEGVVGHLYTKCWDATITPLEREMLKPGYFNYQDLLAQKKLQEIDQNIVGSRMKNVIMVYDVSDKSEFVRAYMIDGKQLDINNPEDKKIIDLYDQCFHSWLVNNNMSSQDGIVFETTKLDKKGNYVERASAENIATLINDPERGIDATVKKQSGSLELKVQRFQQKAEPAPTVRAEKNA